MSNVAAETKYPLFDFLRSLLRSQPHVLSPTTGESAESKRRTLLRMLSVAHAQRLDASILVCNLAEEYHGRYRRHLVKLSERLAAGTPVAAALEQTPGTVGEDDVLALHFAHQTGTVRQVFDQLLSEERDALQSNYTRDCVRSSLGYTVGTMLCTIAAILFMIVFIVPTLRALVADFGLATPWGLESLVAFSQGIRNDGPAILVGVIGVIAVLWIASAKGWFKLSAISRRFGVRRYARSVDLLRLLSIATEAGRPIPAALSTLARFHFDKGTRQQLLLARNEVELGVDVWQSLDDADLLTSVEAECLSSLEDSQVRAWAMRQLAETKQEKIGRRNGRLASLIPPIAVLSLALVVAWLGIVLLQLLSSIVLFTA